MKFKLDKKETLKKCKEILGCEYVKSIIIDEGNYYTHINIRFTSIIFSNTLHDLNEYFKTEFSTICHRPEYNLLTYLIKK